MRSLSLESIIPLLEGDKIFEVDFTTILSILSKESTIQNASKNELNHLCGRVNNYLKSNNTKYRWLGTKLFVVLNLHPELLMSSHTINFINALIKIIESKCFIQDFSKPTYQELITLRSAVDALEFVIEKINGKPALTREVLTPKLPSAITVLLDSISLIPEKAIPLLYKLLLNKSTTFRPFGAKFEKTLLSLLNDDEYYDKFDSKLTKYILKSLVLLSFSLTRSNPQEIWRQKVNGLILETKSVLSIYSHFLNMSEDQDLSNYLDQLPKLPEDLSTFKTNFQPLSIDVNESALDILKVNRRLDLLISLLTEYLKTSTTLTVKIPLGYLVLIGEVLVGFNLRFSTIKREIRDTSIRASIVYSISQLNKLGARLLGDLPELYGGDVLPHLHSILSSLETVIPVERVNGKIMVDPKAVIEHEELTFEVLNAVHNYLDLVEMFTDMGNVNKIIDASLILTKTRQPKVPDNDNNNNGAKNTFKNKKAKGVNSSFSDLLSHQHLFVIKPTEKKLSILRKFFSLLLSKCYLSSSKQSDVLRFAIIDAVSKSTLLKNGVVDNSNRDIIELLQAALLYPGSNASSISVLPIISNLIGDNDTLTSVLTNPRFPLLSKKSKHSFTIDEPTYNDDEVELGEKEQDSVAINEHVKRVFDQVTKDEETKENKAEAEAKRRKSGEIEKRKEEDHQQMFKSTSITQNAPIPVAIKATEVQENLYKTKVDDVIIPESNVTNVPVTISNDADDDSDIGSDFEIPEIDVGDESDEDEGMQE